MQAIGQVKWGKRKTANFPGSLRFSHGAVLRASIQYLLYHWHTEGYIVAVNNEHKAAA